MPVSTPPFIPRFGAGNPTQAVPKGTLYFDTSATLAGWIRQNISWTRFGGVIIGNGVPTMLAPAGFLYSRKDVIQIYQSTPTPVAVTIVQSAYGHGAFTPTAGATVLGVAPTPGNLLIALFSFKTSVSTITSSWTQIDSGFTNAIIVYRYVQSGDTVNTPVISNVSTIWGATVVEISGVSGDPAYDIASFSTISGQGTPFNTPSFLTTAAGQRGILCAYDPVSGTAIPNPATWTSVLSSANGDGVQLVTTKTPASGTDLSATLAPTGGSNNGAMTVLLNPGFTAGWTLVV